MTPTESTTTTEASTMLRSATELRGYRLKAKDGTIGKVSDVYFDDKDWLLRYFVVDTGAWLNKRPVLISPLGCGHPDWAEKTIPVDLTQQQVKDSPAANLAEPVSKQYVVDLHAFYGWPMPWSAGLPDPDAGRKTGPLGDRHLRSVREVTGYAIKAADGEIGHVEDFVVEESTWPVRYMVVDTRNWIPGRKVLVAPAWISEVRWPDGQVNVDLTREAIRNSPAFNPAAPINRGYEEQLFDYYGRRRYW